MLKDSNLDEQFAVKQVTCLIDPTNFQLLLKSIPNIENQLKSADLVIINKSALVEESEIENIEFDVSSINPDAKTIRTNYCEFDLTELDTNPTTRLAEDIKVDSSEFSSYSIKSKRDLNLAELKRFAKLHKAIFRIKGFMNIEGVMHYLSFSGSGWDVSVRTDNAIPHLEFIFKKGDMTNSIEFRKLSKILFQNI